MGFPTFTVRPLTKKKQCSCCSGRQIWFFDTAEVYGTPEDPHVNERLVGEALASVRDKVVIATKFCLRFDFESGKVPIPLLSDSRPGTIRKSVVDSLNQLQTDHIDLYFQHQLDCPYSVPAEGDSTQWLEAVDENK